MSVKSWISVESMSVKAWIYFTGNLGARNVLLDENNRAKVEDFAMALSDKYPHDNFYKPELFLTSELFQLVMFSLSA